MFLFIDTTEKITLGLMNEDMEWIEFISENKSKISSQIHMFVFELCEKHNCEISELSGVIYSAGPGSYTGMRVSEGLSDILAWNKIQIYTFYHFEIPKLLGVESGQWISEAFKGEYFLYSWAPNTDAKKELVKKESYIFENVKDLYAKNDAISNKINNFTDLMIENNSRELFKQVIERGSRSDILYYRKLEEEFGLR